MFGLAPRIREPGQEELTLHETEVGGTVGATRDEGVSVPALWPGLHWQIGWKLEAKYLAKSDRTVCFGLKEVGDLRPKQIPFSFWLSGLLWECKSRPLVAFGNLSAWSSVWVGSLMCVLFVHLLLVPNFQVGGWAGGTLA